MVFRSAHGFADTDMKTIMTQLKREEEDLVGHRGLLPASDQQTFQMFIPSQLRDYYQRVMATIPNVMFYPRNLCMPNIVRWFLFFYNLLEMVKQIH